MFTHPLATPLPESDWLERGLLDPIASGIRTGTTEYKTRGFAVSRFEQFGVWLTQVVVGLTHIEKRTRGKTA